MIDGPLKSQPFACDLCDKKFTRLENLKRHKKQHFDNRFSCTYCSNVYSRSDSLKTHVRRVHTANKDWTTVGSPNLDIKSRLSFLRDIGGDSSVTTPRYSSDSLANEKREDIDRYIELYWTNFHPTFPVLHKPTFQITDDYEEDVLVNVVCAVGLRYCGELNKAANAYTFALYKLEHAFNANFTIRYLQAAMIAVYAGLFIGNDDWYKWAINSHFQLVSIARENGMFQCATDQSIEGGDEYKWDEFVIIESRRRISYALYLIDAQMATLLNYPPKLSHYEIKHVLPCSDEAWEAASELEWSQIIETKNDSEGHYFLDSLQQALVYGTVPRPMSSFGSVLILLAIHIMVRNTTQYAGIMETVPTAFDPFSRRSQLGQALNGLRELIPRRKRSYVDGPLRTMWDMFEANWNLAYIHLHLPDTVITSGIVEVTLNATIATMAALAKPQSMSLRGTALLSNDYTRIPYETFALVANSHVLFFLGAFRLKYKETNPALTLMFYKGALVAWQILKSASPSAQTPYATSEENSQKRYMMQRLAFDIMVHIDEHTDNPGMENVDIYQNWVKSLLMSYDTWGIGASAAASFKELLSD